MARLHSNGCIYPFRAQMLQPGVAATPCCRFHNRFLSDSDKDPAHLFADIQEYQIRGEWHPGCYKCRADEDAGKTSMRTEADDLFEDFTTDQRLEYMEITVGRLCNLACASCGPEFSHTWDRDTLALGLETAAYVENLKRYNELDLDNIPIDVLKYLRNIKVTGGEPFLHRQFLRFVIRLADAGIAENIRIEIFTNCTWYPEKMEMAALLKFKQVRITTSLDGRGPVNDVLRYPSEWSRVESVLDKWIAVRDSFGAPYNRKFIVSAAPTVGVINAPHMFEFMHWARVHKQIEVVLQTVYEPHHLSITHWPAWFKRRLQFVVDMQFQGFNNRADKLRPAHTLISKLCSTPSGEDRSSQYLRQINQLLKHRGQTIETADKFWAIINLEAEQNAPQ